MALNLNIPQSELRKFESQLKRFNKRQHNNLSREIADATLTADRLAKKKAPAREGDLRQGIRSEVSKGGNDMTGEIRSNADYSAAVEFGTKPHIIRAKDKKVLANARTGQFFGKKVRHPGTSPQPFLLPSVKFAYRKMISNIEKLFK